MSTPAGHRADGAGSGPLAGVAVCTLFAGEPAQLAQWCNFHLGAGAEQLYVVLDRPSAELVAALPDVPRVQWHPIDQETWETYYPRSAQNVERKQVDSFRLMARRAREEGHEFLAFVDGDELLHLLQPFTDLAERSPDASAFVVPVRELWFDAGDAGDRDDAVDSPFGASLALRPSSAREVSWRRAFGWRAQFLRGGVMGHDSGKTIYRLPLCSGEISVHRPQSGRLAATLAELPPEAAMLLHFDSGSLTTWNRKWTDRLGGDTLALGLGPHRNAQQGLFAHMLRQGPDEQARFFREFYGLDTAAQDLLRGAGVLDRFEVGDRLEGPVSLPVPTSTPTGLRRLPDLGPRVDFQFAMVCDKRFVRPTFATMLSVLSQIGHRGTVRFVVLGDGLDPADAARLRSLEHTRYDVTVVVHDITADLDRDIGTEDQKRATFGRIYLIDYLPPQRTVYLDGDVLATRDFSELFDLDLQGACLAGVPDSAALRLVANPAGVPIQQRTRLLGITRGDPLEYLNGGVLIFDLDNPDFRALALEARMLVVMQGSTLKQRDQDAMNIAFSGRKHRLPSTYNYMTQFYASDRCLDGDLIRLKYEAADANLIHFSGKIKPWESPDDEFYNGLYRRLVSEAEATVGMSCEFYFSKPQPAAARRMSAGEWTEHLAATPERVEAPDRRADLEVLDLHDSGAYLQLTPDMYETAVRNGLSLAGVADGRTLFEVPLKALSPVLVHLGERVAPAVRHLPFDLAGALAPLGGAARGVDLTITAPGRDHVRLVGVVDLLVTGAAAIPSETVRGVVETVSDGYLTGWYLSPEPGYDDALSFYIDGELVALRSPDLRRPELGERGRQPGFKFYFSRLVAQGYGAGGAITEVSVRVAGTGIPLHGMPLRLEELRLEGRYDASRGEWTLTRPAPPERPSLVRRAGRKLLSRR